jgi:hypothetical protein
VKSPGGVRGSVASVLKLLAYVRCASRLALFGRRRNEGSFLLVLKRREISTIHADTSERCLVLRRRLSGTEDIVTYLNSGPQNGYSGTRTRICAVLPLH